MVQRLTESWVSATKPDSYFDVKIKSTPVGVASSGNIVILGEARGGAAVQGIDSVNGDILKDNYFTPDQLDRVVNKYISGPIVDAFRAIASPSSDEDIVGSANRIYIAKTHIGSQSSAIIASAYGTLQDKNYGSDGDRYYYQISKIYGETAPVHTGTDLSWSPIAEVTTFVCEADVADSLDGDYIYLSSPAQKYHIWFNTTGGAAVDPDPDPGVSLPIEVPLTTGAAAIVVADAIRTKILASFATVFSTDAAGSATIVFTNIVGGVVVAVPTVGTTGWGTPPVINTPGDDADGSFLNGASFTIRELGEAAQIITLSALEGDHDSIADLAAEIQTLLTAAGINVTCVVSGSALKFESPVIVDNVVLALSYGRNFELYDSTPGDLVALGLTANIYVASQEPEIQVDINRQDIGVDEDLAVKAEIALIMGYDGTSGTVSINSSGVLSTAVVGGTGTSIVSLDITNYPSIKDLADYINALTGYSASFFSVSGSLPTSALDVQSAVGIAASKTIGTPGRLRKSLYNFERKLSESAVLDFTATASAGLPQLMSAVAYLSGGARGATTAANVVSAIADLETISTNFVIPLFSRDATDDIIDGLTDSSSTYTINAINTAVKSHVLKMSTAKVKRHRLAICSYWGAFTDIQSQSGSLTHSRMSLVLQKGSQVDSVGEIQSFLPWYNACIAAGMQTAGFYKAIVNKQANVISFEDPTGFDSGSPGDVETGLESGLLFLEKAVSGNTWVSDQTTYGVDTNFVYNSIQAMYTSDIVTLDLSASFKNAFVGKSLADVDASTALAFLASKMDSYKKQKLIAASDGTPLGFRNAKVSISGPIMYVSVEIKLATAVYFIPIVIEISQVLSSSK